MKLKIKWNWKYLCCSTFFISEKTFFEMLIYFQLYVNYLRGYSLSTDAKFSGRQLFLTPWYANVRVRIRGLEMLVFRKLLRTYVMNDPLEKVPDKNLVGMYFNVTFLWVGLLYHFSINLVFFSIANEGHHLKFKYMSIMNCPIVSSAISKWQPNFSKVNPVWSEELKEAIIASNFR